jgi:4-amino-4-deoxy-L-arabinose transferase-like glycosyltransferase
MRLNRFVHWLTLLLITGALTLPNLGAHSLWDMDEGVNAECGREMIEAGTWVVPTFNWELRSAKPVLTYWLQRPSYLYFGINEWAARFPSVLLGLGSVLLTYELGRRMFDPITGLLAGVVLASSIQFCILSHAATPDAPLIFFLTATFVLIWHGLQNQGRSWLVWPAIPCGLAVLAKGPVGLALPGLAVLLYLLWNREWRRLLDHKLVYGVLLFLAVAAPWYILVTAETRGEWAERFFLKENLSRIGTPQENHSGPPYYYVLAILVLFAPWSSVIGLTFWYGVESARSHETHMKETLAHRFLICWFLANLVPFSFFQTKLPNYIAPLYPALALLTARFLIRWQRGDYVVPRWLMFVGTGGVLLTGLGYAIGFLIASGSIPLDISGMRTFPGLERWAGIGVIPVVAAGIMTWALLKGRRDIVVTALSMAAVGFVGLTAAGPVLVIDQYKAAKPLVLESGANQTDREIRLGSLGYFSDSQSIVFYARRRVEVFATADQAREFLALPIPSFLFIPAREWETQMATRDDLPPHEIVARRYDFYRNGEVLVVANKPEQIGVKSN